MTTVAITETTPVSIGDFKVGAGQPVYVIAEIGINHNGDLDIAKQLIDVAADAGAKRSSSRSAPRRSPPPMDMRDKIRARPRGAR